MGRVIPFRRRSSLPIILGAIALALVAFAAIMAFLNRCACRKLDSDILMMKSAQDWATKNVPGAIDGARYRCILVQ